jgi:hypothetical protein
MADSGIYRTPALQGCQRTNVVSSANCLRDAARQAATAIKAERRAQERRKANLGPSGPEHRRGERGTSDRRR